jgi:hypothetical protein
VTTPQGDRTPSQLGDRRASILGNFFGRVGEFYRHPEPNRKHHHVVSLAVLGCAALLYVSLLLPYFNPPIGGAEYFLYLSGLTVLLGGVAILRKERGAIGAAAAVAATGAAAFIVFMFAFAFGISWLLGVMMPD